MIEYVILGTSHFFQDEPDIERPVRRACEGYGIKMVAEEFPFEAESVVCRVAREMQIPYLQIDLNPGEQIGHGIYDELRKRNECLAREDCRLSHADEIREECWLDRIEANVNSGRVLVVCGYLHVSYFSEKVARHGGRVEGRIFSPPSLDLKPSMILSPAELDDYCRKHGPPAGWPATF